MDNINDKIQLFEDKKIRTAWDEENEEWYFSIIDVISVLTEQADYQGARNYWKVLKKRLKDEGNERGCLKSLTKIEDEKSSIFCIEKRLKP